MRKVGILPPTKKNITLQTILTGTLIPFCEAILGYFGIIDILFSHPVSKLGELKVWRNFWSSDDIQSHRRRSDLYSIRHVWDPSDCRKILFKMVSSSIIQILLFTMISCWLKSTLGKKQCKGIKNALSEKRTKTRPMKTKGTNRRGQRKEIQWRKREQILRFVSCCLVAGRCMHQLLSTNRPRHHAIIHTADLFRNANIAKRKNIKTLFILQTYSVMNTDTVKTVKSNFYSLYNCFS